MEHYTGAPDGGTGAPGDPAGTVDVLGTDAPVRPVRSRRALESGAADGSAPADGLGA